MAEPILHPRLTHAPWQSPQTARLPGTTPVASDAWLSVDDAHAAQMAERDRLIAERPSEVMAGVPGSEEAQAELLDTLLDALAARKDYAAEGAALRRPDGRLVAIDRGAPLATLGRLVQEDLCLLDKPAGADEHVLTAAVLCFPAMWTLAEKIGRPLVAIHRPVPDYDAGLAARVQRLFDGLRPVEAGGRILMRMNALDHPSPALFQTRREAEPREQGRGAGGFLRIERQCLRKLPRTGAVVFSIHTTVLDRAALSPDQAAAFIAHSGRH
jgi:hypothetical protein